MANSFDFSLSTISRGAPVDSVSGMFLRRLDYAIEAMKKEEQTLARRVALVSLPRIAAFALLLTTAIDLALWTGLTITVIPAYLIGVKQHFINLSIVLSLVVRVVHLFFSGKIPDVDRVRLFTRPSNALVFQEKSFNSFVDSDDPYKKRELELYRQQVNTTHLSPKLELYVGTAARPSVFDLKCEEFINADLESTCLLNFGALLTKEVPGAGPVESGCWDPIAGISYVSRSKLAVDLLDKEVLQHCLRRLQRTVEQRRTKLHRQFREKLGIDFPEELQRTGLYQRKLQRIQDTDYQFKPLQGLLSLLGFIMLYEVHVRDCFKIVKAKSSGSLVAQEHPIFRKLAEMTYYEEVEEVIPLLDLCDDKTPITNRWGLTLLETVLCQFSLFQRAKLSNRLRSSSELEQAFAIAPERPSLEDFFAQSVWRPIPHGWGGMPWYNMFIELSNKIVRREGLAKGYFGEPFDPRTLFGPMTPFLGYVEARYFESNEYFTELDSLGKGFSEHTNGEFLKRIDKILSRTKSFYLERLLPVIASIVKSSGNQALNKSITNFFRTMINSQFNEGRYLSLSEIKSSHSYFMAAIGFKGKIVAETKGVIIRDMDSEALFLSPSDSETENQALRNKISNILVEYLYGENTDEWIEINKKKVVWMKDVVNSHLRSHNSGINWDKINSIIVEYLNGPNTNYSDYPVEKSTVGGED